MKIKIVDTFRKNQEHNIFNSLFLKIISEIENEKEICFFGKKTHIQEIKKINNLKNINYLEIQGIQSKGKINMLLSYLIASLNDLIIYIFSKKKEKLVYLTVNPFSFIWIRLANRILKKNIYMVCHGELEYLIKNNSNNLYKYFGKIYKFQFNLKINDNIKYILLGESIEANLIKYNLKNEKNIFTMNHPYIFKENKQKKSTKNKIFGTVGLANKTKGTDNILKIAEKFSEIKNIKFKIVGKVCFEIDKNLEISFFKDKDLIPREIFEKEIQTLDYIFYFYSTDSYKLTASGAFLDALSFRKPILALKNDFFEYYFKKYGNIGYLFENVDEMEVKIREILRGETEMEEVEIYQNIDYVREQLSLDNIKKEMLKWW